MRAALVALHPQASAAEIGGVIAQFRQRSGYLVRAAVANARRR